MNISIRGILQLFKHKPKSSDIAKQRLELVITQDRINVDTHMIMRLQHELTEVLAKYFEFSINSVHVSLKHEDSSCTLVVDFPYQKARGLSVNR